MKVPIISIGNSRGIRIPKTMLDQAGLSDVAELTVEKGRLELRPEKKVRDGWEKAFQKMAAAGDDTLLDAGSTDWDDLEWEW